MVANGQAPKADSVMVSHPGYPKANVQYFSYERCVADNQDSTVTCYKTGHGTWVALAAFPTLIDDKGFRSLNAYYSREDLLAINGIGTPYAVDMRTHMYYVPGRGGPVTYKHLTLPTNLRV